MRRVKVSKYHKEIKPGVIVDVYDVLKAFDVTCPATAHAIKKLLMPGERGAKDKLTDLIEAARSIDRAIELESYNIEAQDNEKAESSNAVASFKNADVKDMVKPFHWRHLK